MDTQNTRKTKEGSVQELRALGLPGQKDRRLARPSLPVPIRYMVDSNYIRGSHPSSLKNRTSDTFEISDALKKIGKIQEWRREEPKRVAQKLPESWRKQTIFVPEESEEESVKQAYDPSTELSSLNGLYQLLVKFFNNEQLDIEDLDLKNYELTMALRFIGKKHRTTQYRLTIHELEKKMDKAVFFELLSQLIRKKSSRRLAEEIKLIFNFTIKQMKVRFQKSCSLYTTFSKINTVFYANYFNQLMYEKGVKLNYYYDPQQQKKDQKNYKFDYLERLFESKEFKADFMQFLSSGEFLRQYLKVIPAKLKNILKKFDRFFQREGGVEKGLEAFDSYFNNNKRCKLPWTRSELTTGVSAIISYFND